MKQAEMRVETMRLRLKQAEMRVETRLKQAGMRLRLKHAEMRLKQAEMKNLSLK